jgi:hypothetical protein
MKTALMAGLLTLIFSTHPGGFITVPQGISTAMICQSSVKIKKGKIHLAKRVYKSNKIDLSKHYHKNIPEFVKVVVKQYKIDKEIDIEEFSKEMKESHELLNGSEGTALALIENSLKIEEELF